MKKSIKSFMALSFLLLFSSDSAAMQASLVAGYIYGGTIAVLASVLVGRRFGYCRLPSEILETEEQQMDEELLRVPTTQSMIGLQEFCTTALRSDMYMLQHTLFFLENDGAEREDVQRLKEELSAKQQEITQNEIFLMGHYEQLHAEERKDPEAVEYMRYYMERSIASEFDFLKRAIRISKENCKMLSRNIAEIDDEIHADPKHSFIAYRQQTLVPSWKKEMAFLNSKIEHRDRLRRERSWRAPQTARVHND